MLYNFPRRKKQKVSLPQTALCCADQGPERGSLPCALLQKCEEEQERMRVV